MLTKDEFTELFETSVRGSIALAFARSGVSPSEYWPMIRGDKPITLRVIGEISHITGHSVALFIKDQREEQVDG